MALCGCVPGRSRRATREKTDPDTVGLIRGTAGVLLLLWRSVNDLSTHCSLSFYEEVTSFSVLRSFHSAIPTSGLKLWMLNGLKMSIGLRSELTKNLHCLQSPPFTLNQVQMYNQRFRWTLLRVNFTKKLIRIRYVKKYYNQSVKFIRFENEYKTFLEFIFQKHI